MKNRTSLFFMLHHSDYMLTHGALVSILQIVFRTWVINPDSLLILCGYVEKYYFCGDYQ